MQGRDDRSLGELFSELAQETSTLVRQEVTLAKIELTHKASTAGRHVGILAAGGALPTRGSWLS
jgi:Putative Actinobacterial Holin-X, holin superfamily III